MKTKASILLHILGIIFGVLCLLLVFVNKGYEKRIYLIKSELFAIHQSLGIEKLKSDNNEDALFHFRSMIFLEEKQIENMFQNTSNEWGYKELLMLGIAGNLFLDAYEYENLNYGTAKALYGNVLHKSGKVKEAKKQYVEAALGLSIDIKNVERYAETIINTEKPTKE